MKKLFKRCVVVTTIATLMAAAWFLAFDSPLARANGGSIWSNDSPPSMSVDEIQKPYDFPPTQPAECSREKIYLGNDPRKANVCVVERNGWRFGKYSYPGGSPNDRSGYAIGFGLDTKMYRMRGMSYQSQLLSPNTNAFRLNNGYYETLNILRNPAGVMKRISNPSNGAVEYRLNWWDRDLILQEPNGRDQRVGVIAVSPNGRWLAVEAIGRGIVFVDLKTEEVKLVSRARGTTSDRSHLSVHIAISDDGKYIATAGTGMQERVITVDKDCGVPLPDDEQNHGGRPLSNPCEELDLWSYFQHNVDNYAHAVFPVFGADGTTLNINVSSYTDGTKWVALKTGDDNPPLPTEPIFHLDYLALGDSYSSGEGDTKKDLLTRQKYYLPFTDIEGSETVPEEKCHVSSRSYPFVLREMMGIPTTRMKSVACSGAHVAKDYAQDNDSYYGQDERLKVLGPGMVEAYKADALNEFIPGRNQQVEFVRIYQPKAITLTGGGNDAGFGDVAIACAVPNRGSSACRYADTKEGKAALGRGIGDQYDNLVRLYSDLHAASPNTKIYVLGYPQFLSSNNEYCAPNVRFNQEERIMARAAVVYINNVIEAATKAAGVKYIDIEESLGDHTLCGSQESYVTGLAMSGKITTDIPELFSQESFHPNAKGHQKIAETVHSALGNTSIDEYEYCEIPGETLCPKGPAAEPEIPEFFTKATNSDTTNYIHSQLVDKDIIQKGKDTFMIQLGGLKPNTAAGVWAFSDPTNLGTYTTDVAGSLNINIPIPESLPAGAHTLQIESQTFSDEPITLWQTIWVAGREGDIDENGIQDALQTCLFVSDPGIDKDEDGVDDACDLEVEFNTSVALNNTSSLSLQQQDVVTSVSREMGADQFSERDFSNKRAGIIPGIPTGKTHTMASLLGETAEVQSAQDRLPLATLTALSLAFVVLLFVGLKRIVYRFIAKR